MRVLLVTTWGIACGIAETAAYLKEAVEAANPSIELVPCDTLNPALLSIDTPKEYPIIHLNYHAALHSQWTPAWIQNFQAVGAKVLVTYHDTGVPNSDQCKGICAAADAFVVHEPCDDLALGATADWKGHYWRQGVPGWTGEVYSCKPDGRPLNGGRRPVVGTVGFPFPWKNYDLVCKASALAGWGCLLIAPQATEDQEARWRSLNPELAVIRDFVPRGEIVPRLAGCDATAFLYSCANTGTSGAIRQGIAARKPLLALSGCRQFRDLEEDPEERAITWCPDGSPRGVAEMLSLVQVARVHPPMVVLAKQDSWVGLGQKYAALYRTLVV